jgi:hypothetical protein
VCIEYVKFGGEEGLFKLYQRGEFLDEIQTKVRVFLLAIHSHHQRFAFAFKLTQPLTVSTVQLLYTVKESSVTVHCKGERGKHDRKPYYFPIV